MIVGIGIDVVHTQRLRRWEAVPGLFDRYYHPAEVAESARKGAGGILSLAARFAAKEAFGKALGSGLKGIILRDIIVTNDAAGKPIMHLEGTARAALEKAGGQRVLVSLSHEQDNALAMVVIEATP